MKTLAAIFEVTSFFLVQPELFRLLMGKDRTDRAVQFVQAVSFWFVGFFQKYLVRVRFRLLFQFRKKLWSRELFYKSFAYTRKLIAFLYEKDAATRGLSSEEVEELIGEIKEFYNLAGQTEPQIRELLDKGEYEQVKRKLLSLSTQDLESQSIEKISVFAPQDWIKLFLSLGLGLLISIPFMILQWWLVIQSWDTTVLILGILFVGCLYVFVGISGFTFQMQLYNHMGWEGPFPKVPISLKVPILGELDLFYGHYRFRHIAHPIYLLAMRIILVLLALHVFQIIQVPAGMAAVLAGSLFGVSLLGSFHLLFSVISLPIYILLALAAWVTVLGQRQKLSQITAVLGVVLFVLAQVLSIYT